MFVIFAQIMPDHFCLKMSGTQNIMGPELQAENYKQAAVEVCDSV